MAYPGMVEGRQALARAFELLTEWSPSLADVGKFRDSWYEFTDASSRVNNHFSLSHQRSQVRNPDAINGDSVAMNRLVVEVSFAGSARDEAYAALRAYASRLTTIFPGLVWLPGALTGKQKSHRLTLWRAVHPEVDTETVARWAAETLPSFVREVQAVLPPEHRPFKVTPL